MREVFEHYGRVILEGMVIVTLFSMLFVGMQDEKGNQGLYAIVGAQIEIKESDYRTYSDFKKVYKEECQKTPPYIFFEGEGIEIGTIVISNYIKAVDYIGRPLNVGVVSIKAPDELEMIRDYNTCTGEIYLSKAGVYTFSVYAKDESNKLTEAIIQIPINQKRGVYEKHSNT